jgi:hypothetical protein
MRLLLLLIAVLLELKNCNAASSYTISTGSVSSACSSSYINPQSFSAGCGGNGGTCAVGDTVTLVAKGET